MSKAVSALVLLAAMGIGAAHAQDFATADGATVVTGITAPQLIQVLAGQGVTATLAVGSEGDPIVDGTASNGDVWSIYMYRCSGAKAKSCTVLQFQAVYELSGDGAKLMADYNSAWVFGRARLNDAGDGVIDYLEDLEGGITLANLRGTLAQWDSIVLDFVDHITK